MSEPHAAGDRRRSHKQPVGFALTDRDRKLLGIFRDVRFVRSSHLEQLCIPLLFPSNHALRLRLHRLKAAGYLELPAKALKPAYTSSKRAAHRPENIWAVSRRGGAAIGLGADFTKNNARLSGRDPFTHALEIASVYTVLQLGAHDGAFTFTSWIPENQFREEVTVTHQGRTLRLPVCPDGVAVLERGGRELEVFLEVDCATEPLTRSDLTRSSFFKKVLAYQQFWREERAREQKTTLIVLTIAPTQQRVEALTETARTADPRRQGLNIFMFTSRERWPDADPGVFVTEPIWSNPAGDELRLVDLLASAKKRVP